MSYDVVSSRLMHTPTCPGTLLAAIANPRLPPTPGTITTTVGAVRVTAAAGGGTVGFGGDDAIGAAAAAADSCDDTLIGGGGFAYDCV